MLPGAGLWVLPGAELSVLAGVGLWVLPGVGPWVLPGVVAAASAVARGVGADVMALPRLLVAVPRSVAL
ncbi:MAG: hypothetical protein ACXVEU_18295 [Nocardioidaceae bacterium]